jgi:hypothetical protein
VEAKERVMEVVQEENRSVEAVMEQEKEKEKESQSQSQRVYHPHQTRHQRGQLGPQMEAKIVGLGPENQTPSHLPLGPAEHQREEHKEVDALQVHQGALSPQSAHP